MAIFHLHVKNISRGDGRSAVAAAAYRAGETLPNEIEERDSAFGGRRDVLHAEIVCPVGVPPWMLDRATLWNAVEAAERRKDARLAKEIEAALPRELPPEAWLVVCRTFAAHYAGQGFVADFSIHDDGSAHNPHVHVMLTTRIVTGAGFGGKIRSADGRQFVEDARAVWAELVNAALAKAGLDVSVDPRSHARAGVDRVPTQHRGPDAAERRSRREKMGLSRLLMSKVVKEPDGERARLLRDWPASQMRHSLAENGDTPVPGPDGGLISQGQLDEAQTRMLDDMESPSRDEPARALARRWSENPEPSHRPPQDHTAPFTSRRWATEVSDPEPADEREASFRSRRWETGHEDGSHQEPEREREYEERVRERTRD